jgi:hypothetical protein
LDVTSVTRSTRALALIAIAAAILGTACGGGTQGAAGHEGQPVPTASAAPRSSAAEPSPSSVEPAPTSSTTTVAPGTRAVQPTLTPTNATAPAAPPGPAPAPGRAADAAPGSRFVTAFGVRLAVPADWPVYDLATDVRRCVRADRHAVYLGHAGPNQDCPTQVVGRVETVQIEPLDEQTGPDVGLATASSDLNGVAVQLDPAADTTHAVVAVVPTDRVVVTITFETDKGRAEEILQSLEHVANPSDTGVQAQDQPVSCGALGCPGNPGVVYTGLGFDACAAPTTSQMSAWLASPFRSIGIYIGGANRGCSQPNLTASWVSTVLGQGWKLVPIYVGLQAPCASISAAKIDPANAGAQGAAAAVDAMNRAAALGIGAQRPLILDMEAYNNSDASCVAAVRAFVSGWAGRLHQGAYLAGFYSSAASGIADQSAIATNPAYNHLDLIWFAHWNNDPTVNEPNKTWLPDSLWTNHQRMHQYRGGQQETFGGVTINIDRDYVDAQVVG